MTKLRSRNLVKPLRDLFNGGTLTGLGEGELLERFASRRDEAAFEELIHARREAAGNRHVRRLDPGLGRTVRSVQDQWRIGPQLLALR